MFPYKDEEGYKSHDFYKSIEEVNIGGIPFLPSTTGLMEEFIDKLIDLIGLLYDIYRLQLPKLNGEKDIKNMKTKLIST